MIIDANDDEIVGNDQGLDLAESDSLPWLEAEDEDEAAGGFDTSQFVGLLAVLAVCAPIPGRGRGLRPPAATRSR